MNPIYSQHTRGGGKGANNVHKFERYLRHGVTNVVTVYGPVLFGSQPCMLLRETDDSQGAFHAAVSRSLDLMDTAVSFTSTGTGRDGQLHEYGHDTYCCEADRTERAPV